MTAAELIASAAPDSILGLARDIKQRSDALLADIGACSHCGKPGAPIKVGAWWRYCSNECDRADRDRFAEAP